MSGDVRTRTAWEVELGCFGYFGFGGGYAGIKEDKAAPGYGLYCNVCPLAQNCWQEHRRRAAELFPDLMAELQKLLDAHPGDANAAMGAFWARFECAPPDIAINGGNIEDGMLVAHGEAPKDRKRGTLTWPLAPRGRQP